MKDPRKHEVLRFLFRELPLIPLDYRFSRFMAPFRYSMGAVVLFFAIDFLADGLWWGALLIAPVAALLWTGYVVQMLGHDARCKPTLR